MKSFFSDFRIPTSEFLYCSMPFLPATVDLQIATRFSYALAFTGRLAFSGHI